MPKYLEFPVPNTSYGKMVYIKEAYTEIYEKHIEKCEHTLIIGNLGIGKSFFAICCIQTLTRAPSRYCHMWTFLRDGISYLHKRERSSCAVAS